MVTPLGTSSLLRRTWGEQPVGNVGIGLIFGLLAILAIILGAFVVFFLVQIAVELALVAFVVAVLIVGTIALVGAAVSGIFVASLYRYATKGDAGPMYQSETMAAAFRTRS